MPNGRNNGYCKNWNKTWMTSYQDLVYIDTIINKFGGEPVCIQSVYILKKIKYFFWVKSGQCKSCGTIYNKGRTWQCYSNQ